MSQESTGVNRPLHSLTPKGSEPVGPVIIGGEWAQIWAQSKMQIRCAL